MGDGEACVGPRYYDPLTEYERENLIYMFMHSSVMDYAGELTQDMLGLGAYDFAAARMFYGDAVAVHADETYKVGEPRGRGMLSKMDSFGGILGIQPTLGEDDIHYSALQKSYDLISNCQEIDVDSYKPADWNAERDGEWSPLLDGLLVPLDGKYTKCDQQKVDYTPWDSLSPPGEDDVGFYRGGPAVDKDGRIRMPYGFATDRWADLGNLSVYRHDNGADAYEIFDFLITQQEVNHIFDNYRRDRRTFSVRSAAGRTLRRYNEKVRDGAKGLGLLKNIYRDFALEINYDFDSFWWSVSPSFFPDNILASGMAFDHFARTMARPEVGEHFTPGFEDILRSARDTSANPGATDVVVPNGATGYFGNVSAGGKLVENELADDKGEFDSDFTVNCGSYYDKLYAPMLFTESVDNFISSSRTDFTDARYRAVSLADLFPDGYRRWLANNLTGADELKGARVATSASGKPLVDSEGYPSQGIGWTQWWGRTPKVCFPAEGTNICETYGATDKDVNPFSPVTPEHTRVLDPQVGWEQQKFLIAITLAYLPENQQQEWIDQLRIWELGVDADPGFTNRIEYHHPSGKVYIAKTFGMETLFGQTVQRGISARILGYANGLLKQAYDTDDGPDLNGDGQPDWYVPVFNEETGLPIVKYDKDIDAISDEGFVLSNGTDTCNSAVWTGCTCTMNRACVALQAYAEVPFFLRQALNDYGLASPSPKGIY